MAFFAILFGAIATAGSFFRIFRFGWNLNIVVDIITYVLVALLFMIRRRFNTQKSSAYTQR